MPFHRPIPERKNDGRPSGPFAALVQAEKLMQIAFILPCAAFIGWLGGAWLSNRIDQKWPIAAGVMLGAAAGLVYVIRMALDAMNASGKPDDDSNQKESNKNRP
jgi:hypothetical protein